MILSALFTLPVLGELVQDLQPPPPPVPPATEEQRAKRRTRFEQAMKELGHPVLTEEEVARIREQTLGELAELERAAGRRLL